MQRSSGQIVKVVKYADLSQTDKLYVDSKNIEIEPVTVDRGPVKKALLVGVNRYEKQERFRNLSFCVADMEGLNERLRDGGYKSQHIRLLVTDAGSADQPRKQTIERSLDILLDDVKDGDTVIVSLSGHGVQIGGKSYFCPEDGDPGKPKETLVAIDWLYGQLAHCKAQNRLLIVDACRNEMKRSADTLDDFAASFPSPPEGIAALLSCSAGQTSIEDSGLGHGVFLHFISQGLAGAADRASSESNDIVSLMELTAYAFPKTTEFAKRKNNPQEPLLRGATKDWPIMEVKTDPRVQAAIAKGDAFLVSKLYDMAIKAYGEAIQLDERSHIAYDRRGLAYYESGNFGAAIADTTSAITYASEEASYWFHRGRAYHRSKILPLAVNNYEKAISLDRRCAEAFNGRGAAYAADGQMQLAIDDYEEALSINPSFTYALNNRADAYIGIAQYDKAMADLDRAIAIDPRYAMAYNNRGIGYMKKGDFQRAVTEFTFAIGFDTELVKAYVNRARAYRELKQWQNALQDEAKARQLLGRQ